MRLSLYVSLISVASTVLACQSADHVGPHPAPTGVAPRHEEGELGEGRAKWMERMHRTAPGVDWRAIERENGRREQERRNQMANTSFAMTSPWSEVGSRNQAGRMHVAFHGTDGQTLYGGSSRGGIWRADLVGQGWSPLADNLYGTIDDLIILRGDTPSDPDVMVASVNGSIRVSRDDGQSWQTPTGLSGLNEVRGMARLADASGTVVFYGRQGGQSALYASTDKGLSFTKRWNSTLGYAGWIWVPRIGAESVATIYMVHRGQLQRSTNGGFSFNVLTTISNGTSAAILTGSEAGAPTLYAALDAGPWRLYRSDNAGNGFSLIQSSLGDFWGELCASIQSPNLVVYGGVEAWRSTNGGGSFSPINDWADYYGSPATKLHADMMGLYCWPDPSNPTNQEIWYYCTDGGIYRSVDGGQSVSNLCLTGLGVSQYYSTHTSRQDTRIIVAGSQDQGYQRGIWKTPLPSGPSTDFDQLISGDYGHLTSSNGTHDWLYSTYPGFILGQQGENNPSLFFLDFPNGSNSLWLPPVVADPLDTQAFFFCGDRLYRFSRSGLTWSDTVHSGFNFSGGPASYLTALRFAPTNPQRAYAVTDDGQLHVSINHGVTWTQPAGGSPPEHYFYGNAIAVHPSNELECVVGGSGYSAPGVLRTTNGGSSWQPLTTGLPATLVYALAYAEDGSGDIYAGTETGAYRYDRDAATWVNILANQTPITTYWSVEAVPSEGVMRFGTYGRGIWDFELPVDCVAPSPYGFGETGSTGQLAQMSATGGDPTVGASFSIVGSGFKPNQFGVLFSGTQIGNNVQGWGTIQVGGQLVRTYAQSDGSGVFTVPITITPAMAGTTMYYQYAARDPGFGGDVQHANGLSVTFCP